MPSQPRGESPIDLQMIHGRGLGMKARLSACCTQIERPGRRARRHMVGWEKDEREMSKAATSLWSAESSRHYSTFASKQTRVEIEPMMKRTPRHDILSFFLSFSQSTIYLKNADETLVLCSSERVVTKAAAALHLTKFQLEDQAGMWVYLSFLCTLHLIPLDVKPCVLNPVAPVGNLGSTQEFLYWIQYFHYTKWLQRVSN